MIDPLAEEISGLRKDFSTLTERQQQEATERQQVAAMNLRTAAVGEMRQQLASAPEEIKTAIRGWSARNWEQMIAEGKTEEEAAAKLEEELLDYAVLATRQRMTLPQLWAASTGMEIAEPPPVEEPAAEEVPADVAHRKKARATAPRRIPRGRAPSADASDPIQQLAEEQHKLSGEQLYDRLAVIAKEKKISEDKAESLLMAAVRKLAAA